MEMRLLGFTSSVERQSTFTRERQPLRSPMRTLIFATITTFSFCAQLTAQQIRVVVRDSVTHQAIPAALLTVRGPDRIVKARFLSDIAGRYDLSRAPNGGSLTIEFVGYSPQTLPLRDRDTTLIVSLSPAPFAIASVTARGKGHCGRSADPNIANAWYAARAVLGSTRAARTMQFRVRQFDRPLNMHLKSAGAESMTFSIAQGSRPYTAATGDSLSEYGFVRGTRDGRYFY